MGGHRRWWASVAVGLLVGSGIARGAIEWETTRQTVRLRQGEKEVRTAFRFVNRRAPLKIKHISTSCGCTEAKVADRDLGVDEAGQLDVVFKVDSRRGVQRKYVGVETDEGRNSIEQLVLIVDVPEKLWLAPRFVFWASAADDGVRSFWVDAVGKTRITAVRATATHPDWRTAVQKMGGRYRVELRHPSKEGSTVVAITAEMADEGAVSMPVFARVFGGGKGQP